MIFYVLFFLIIFLITNTKSVRLTRSYRLAGTTFAFVILFLFSALRFDVGYDFGMYYGLIDTNIRWFTDQINRIELIPKKLLQISKWLGFYQLFFIITSLLILYFFHKTINKFSSDKQMSILIFFCFPIFFFMSLSVIRQYVAVAILFYGFKYIRDRKLIKYLILVLIAFLFHKSALLALPIYFFYGNFFVNRNFILIIFIFSFFSSDLLAFLITLISERYAIYINEIEGEGGNLILILIKLIGLLLLPFVYITKNQNDKDYNFYLVTFYVGIFLWSSLSKFGHAGIRSSLYYMSFLILLLPKLKNKIIEYSIIKEVLFLLCITLYFGNLHVGSKHRIKDPNIPYQTYFFKTMKDLKPDQ